MKKKALIIGGVVAAAMFAASRVKPSPQPIVTPTTTTRVIPRAVEKVSYWAEIDAQGVVQGVYVFKLDATEATCRALFKRQSTFVRTRDPNDVTDTRGRHYAGKGYVYDPARAAFKPPRPFPSWTLNDTTLQYDPPIARPTEDGKVRTWNETRQRWDEATR